MLMRYRVWYKAMLWVYYIMPYIFVFSILMTFLCCLHYLLASAFQLFFADWLALIFLFTFSSLSAVWHDDALVSRFSFASGLLLHVISAFISIPSRYQVCFSPCLPLPLDFISAAMIWPLSIHIITHAGAVAGDMLTTIAIARAYFHYGRCCCFSRAWWILFHIFTLIIFACTQCLSHSHFLFRSSY